MNEPDQRMARRRLAILVVALLMVVASCGAEGVDPGAGSEPAPVDPEVESGEDGSAPNAAAPGDLESVEDLLAQFGEAGLADFVQQPMLRAQVLASEPLLIPLLPGGGDTMMVNVISEEALDLEIRVLDRDGNPVTAYVDSADQLGVQMFIVVVSGLGGVEHSLEITSEVDTAVTVAPFGVGMGVGLSLSSAESQTPGIIDFVAELSGVTDPATAEEYVVTVTYDRDQGDVATLVLTSDGQTATGWSYVGTATDAAPGPQGFYLEANGPVSLSATDGAMFADGTGSITGLVSDALVDRDGDGFVDFLQLEIAVEVDVAGDYSMTAQLMSQSGEFLNSAYGEATLTAGANTIVVFATLKSLMIVGVSGVYEVANVSLMNMADFVPIGESTSLGSTAFYDLTTVIVQGVAMTRPVGAGVDADSDGVFDQLVFTTTVTVPVDGTYEFRSALTGPPFGGLLEDLSEFRTLTAGQNIVSFEFDGSLVVEGGSGTYRFTQLQSQLDTDYSIFGSTPSGKIDLDVADW